MAIQCRICQSEVDALAGGRCRRCRQLVCARCIASGSARSPEGLVCVACAAKGEENAEAPAPPSSRPEPKTRERSGAPPSRPGPPVAVDPLPLWLWIGLGVVLALLFVGIVFFPLVQIHFLARRVREAPTETGRAAAAELARMGAPRAFDALEELAAPENDAAIRIRAIEAMGRASDARAEPLLRRIAADTRNPPPVRLAAEEALVFRRNTLIPESDG